MSRFRLGSLWVTFTFSSTWHYLALTKQEPCHLSSHRWSNPVDLCKLTGVALRWYDTIHLSEIQHTYFYLLTDTLHRYRMDFDLVHPHYPLIAPSPTGPFFLPIKSSSPFVSNFSVWALGLIRVAYMCINSRLFNGAWATNQWLQHWRKWLPLPQ